MARTAERSLRLRKGPVRAVSTMCAITLLATAVVQVLSLETASASAEPVFTILTAEGKGGVPRVRGFDRSAGATIDFNAYSSSFKGGVFVASGDVNGDSVPDIITGTGAGGGPLVEVF